MTYTYKTQGTCSSNIELDVEDGIVKEVAFWGARLEGIRCGRRSTSCPDQLCKALHEMGY